jgi:predicted membrane protein
MKKMNLFIFLLIIVLLAAVVAIVAFAIIPAMLVLIVNMYYNKGKISFIKRPEKVKKSSKNGNIFEFPEGFKFQSDATARAAQ